MNRQSCHRIIPVQWSLGGKIAHELFSTLSWGGSFSTLSHFHLPLYLVMDCVRRKLVSMTIREACFKLNAEMVKISQDGFFLFCCFFVLFCFLTIWFVFNSLLTLSDLSFVGFFKMEIAERQLWFDHVFEHGRLSCWPHFIAPSQSAGDNFLSLYSAM